MRKSIKKLRKTTIFTNLYVLNVTKRNSKFHSLVGNPTKKHTPAIIKYKRIMDYREVFNMNKIEMFGKSVT